MNFDKIAQAANDSSMEKEAKKNNIKNAVAMIDRFPSENEAIKNILNQLVISPDAEIKPYGKRFSFYIVLKSAKNRPDWKETYYESDSYYYIFGDESVTRRCKFNTVAIAYDSETKEISNTLEIPDMSIPYGDIPVVTKFSQKNMPYSVRHEYRQDIVEEYTKIDGKFKPYMKDCTVVANKVDYFRGIGNTEGFIARINFYLEGNEDGESILIENEVSDKLDNEDFEEEFKNAYKKHVLDGISNIDIEEQLEEILCNTFKNHTHIKDADSLYLDFTIYYNKVYVLSDDKPNVNIRFDEMELAYKSYYSDSVKTVGEIKSDNKISIEMSDLFWKHHKTPTTRSIDFYCDWHKGVNSVQYDDILSDDDEEFCDIVCKAISERVAAAGLTVEKYECSWYEDSEYPIFEIQVKNPLKG